MAGQSLMLNLGAFSSSGSGHLGSAPPPGAYPLPIRWHTPLFQLFTADISRGAYEPVWW
jgi:hypothetical protein